MSKFLDRLEEIGMGAPPPLGFAISPRPPKTPGMALVGQVAGNAAGLKAAGELSPDAVFLAGIGGPPALKKLEKALPAGPWGIRTSALNEEDAKAYREAGSDIMVFELAGTAAAAVSSDEVARVLLVELGMEEAEIRSIDSLPVDVLLLTMPDIKGPWTLADLTKITSISRRVSKFILVQVATPPGKGDLEAIRNAGVDGLVVDIIAMGPEAASSLKADLLDMPRQQPPRRGRATAILPGAIFAPPAPRSEPDEDDDDEERLSDSRQRSLRHSVIRPSAFRR